MLTPLSFLWFRHSKLRHAIASVNHDGLKNFYQYQQPEPVEDIVTRIEGLEADITASLKALFGEKGE